MYTVSKGPSKIVAKTRRGLSQNYEKFETIKESSKKSSDYYSPEKISTPRPVFQTTKKTQIHTKQLEEEHISPQHEELINFISNTWNMVVAQNPYDATSPSATTMTNGHATIADSNNNNCSNFVVDKPIMNTSQSLSSATLPVYTNGTTSNSSSSSSLSSISTISSACTTPATSPQPQSPPVTKTLYCVDPRSPTLKDFTPFDLEAWWGRCLFNNITKTI